MNSYLISSLSAAVVLGTVGAAQISYAQATYTGIVERVWEDGFRLNTGDRTITVDSWDVYGDRTPLHIQVGDRISVFGEFENGEFDLFSVTHL